MVKLLILTLVVAIASGGLVYFLFFNKPDFIKTEILTNPLTDSLEQSPPETEQNSSLLENTIISLQNQAGSSASPKAESISQDSSQSSLEVRVKSLEASIADLRVQILQLKQSSPAPVTQSSTSKASIYIPVGSNISANNQDWYSLPTFQINLDPADYPGYTSMQLIASLRLAEAVGTGYVRFYNSTDGKAVSSEISTTSNKDTLATSTTFNLPSGSKTYYIQSKSTQNYHLFIDNAKIKVNF